MSKNWTFGEEYLGKAVRIEAYVDCDEVEFILNGKSLGRTKPQKYIASLDLTFVRVEVRDGQIIDFKGSYDEYLHSQGLE